MIQANFRRLIIIYCVYNTLNAYYLNIHQSNHYIPVVLRQDPQEHHPSYSTSDASLEIFEKTQKSLTKKTHTFYTELEQPYTERIPAILSVGIKSNG